MESKLMTTSEPTTGACRRCGIKISSDQNRCTQCIAWILRLLAKARSTWGSVHEEAADRLESQEKTIAALTARVEQAEKKNAELINKITKLEGGTWT